jgi:hypothetical protein
MDLDQFITTTLLSIKKGIRFDVAVTVSTEKESIGGGKIKIAVVDIGGDKTSASREEYISRISFEIDPFKRVC